MKNQQEREESVGSLMSPSFSSYTSDKLADIADQVNQDYFRSLEPFEFVTFQKAADGVFLDGYAGPVFPVFNRDLSTLSETESDCGDGRGRERDSSAEEDDVMALPLPMRNLMVHDDSDPPSSSSSSSGGDDDLEGIPPGCYCVWTPNSAKTSPGRPKKSNSTGSPASSKRWKLLDFLRQSNSDENDSFVFVTPTSTSGPTLEKKKEVKGVNSKEKVSSHEALYTRNKELSKPNKRRSYLPYRQDLIALGVGVTGR